MVEDFPIIEDYTKWTVKILNHPAAGRVAIGAIETERAYTVNHNTYDVTYYSVFTTDNIIYNYDGINGVNSNTEILDEMPKTARDSLKGEIFDVYYRKDMMLVTNENYKGSDGGRLIRAKLELNPKLNYTPYIATHGEFT